MNDLPLRFITAIVLGVVVIGGIYYSDITFGIVLLIIGYFSSSEYLKLSLHGAEINNPDALLKLAAFGSIFPLGIYLLLSNLFVGHSLVFSLIGSLVLSSLIFLYLLAQNVMGDWRFYQAYSMSLIYIGWPLLLFFWVCNYEGMYQMWKPLSLLVLIWCNDIMAYFTGRLIGKRPLYKEISPKKTFEGFLGGLLFTIVGALVLSIYIHHLSPIQWVIYGFLVSLLATGGDLFESMIKRRYGVKDSGTSLPGHGGFLDRFDAFIFLLPVSSLIIFIFWH